MRKLKDILFSPRKFFKNVIKEKGIKEAFKFLAIYFMFFIIVNAIIFFIIGKRSSYNALVSLPEITNGLWILMFIFIYLIVLLSSFVSAFLLMMWIRIFGGKWKYENAYKLKVYSNAPYYVFGWIPFIGGLFLIYSLILLIIGTKQIFKFSTLKATLIYVIPLIIIFLLFVILFGLLFFALIYQPSEVIF